MNHTRHILFEGHSAESCLLALRDTFGPSLAEDVLLLFADDSEAGNWLDRSQLLAFELPENIEGPFRAIIRAEEISGAMDRLELMGTGHGYGKAPRLIDMSELQQILTLWMRSRR